VSEVTPSQELFRKWEDREAREIRRETADWDFIRRRPPRVRVALMYFIERGDRYVAAKIVSLAVDEFNKVRMRAKMPVVV